jgi:hypothetical protein
MATKALKEALERVERWPEDRQDYAAELLREMDEVSNSASRLTDEQAAEVRRRLGDPDPRSYPIEELQARLSSLGI